MCIRDRYDWFALGPGVAQQRIVSQRRGGNLEARRVELIDEIDRALIPAGSEPRHFHFAAVAGDQPVIVIAEFQASLEIAIGGAEGILARLRQFFRRIDHVHGPFLEFDSVAACLLYTSRCV